MTGPATHTDPRATALAAVVVAIDGLALIFLAFNLAAGTVIVLDASTVGGFALGVAYPLVGWIVAARRPSNPIGWLFLTVGLSQAASALTGQYAIYALVTAPGSLPLGDVMSWLATWTWAPGFVVLLTFSILLFPDGRLLSPRWRIVAWMSAAALLLIVVPIAVISWPLRGPALAAATQGVAALPESPTAMLFEGLGIILLVVAAAASLTSMFVRLRRSDGALRAQLKWLTGAAILEIGVSLGTSFVDLEPVVGAVLAIVVTPLVPIAVGIAILRYRLYEIDRIISRTIAYTVVTAVLVTVFAGLVVGLQAVLDPLTQGQTLAVAVSTLAVAALFQPLRWRVKRLMDRRFDRSAYDGQRIIAALADRLRREVDLGSIETDVIATVEAAVHPAGAGLWVRTAGPSGRRRAVG